MINLGAPGPRYARCFWRSLWGGVLFTCACTPLRDLDAAASGSGAAAGQITATGGTEQQSPAGGTTTSGGVSAGGSAQGGAESGGSSANSAGGALSQGGSGGALSGGTGALGQGGAASGEGGTVASATGGSASEGGTASAGASQGGAGASAGAAGSTSGGTSGSAGTLATGGSAGVAPDLPDITDFPISGEIVLSEEATWTIDGVMMPTDQVQTPVAKFMMVKSAAALVSIEDPTKGQWIAYNSYRPKRGLPALGSCCEAGNPSTLGLPVMTTTLDRDAFSKRHVRLVSKSSSGDVHIVWDFYLTHVTITLNRLKKTPFGFTYRGVPGTQLDATDQIRFPDGTARDANNGWSGDLPGPAEWVYFTDPTSGQSLFLIHHADDDLTESYQVADQDSARFVFSNAESTQLPTRFSVGVINSTNHAQVAERANFVISATH